MGKTKTAVKSTLSSWQDVDGSLKEIAESNAFILERESEMNKKLLEIQNAYEIETREKRDRVLALEKNIELFCIEHRDEFVQSKTRDLNFGLVSFRLTTPKLSTLKGFTWDTVLALLKKLQMTTYVRTKEEVDKDKIKAELTEASELAQIGLHIQQTETFYYEAYKKELVG